MLLCIWLLRATGAKLLVGIEEHRVDEILDQVLATLDQVTRNINVFTTLRRAEPHAAQVVQLGRVVIGILDGAGSISAMRKLDGVLFVEKDRPIRAASLLIQPDPPSYGLERVSSRHVLPDPGYTFDSSAGSGVDVYVLDSGIYDEHEDFENRAFKGKNFVADEDDTDLYGHGTHVAGTVAGKDYGVAKNARVFGVKILNRKGEGTISLAVRAIGYVIKQKEITGRKSIINLSLAGGISRSLNVAVEQAASKHDIPVIVAAGNQHMDACQSSPASASNILSVGNVDQNNQITRTSNFGSCVSLFAPGAQIISASSLDKSGSRILSGTSMAAPHVAGVAALFWSQEPNLTCEELYRLIKQKATKDILTGIPASTPNLMAFNQL
ncbi:hypothetical protein DSO57_1010514 [Entomophthora muscae]|uniref:Uncharacterized protein n=1 Tax=Entomophthora muscae TaxID=34485 RepID=A0ACC2U4W2_9FUNG|nr:hypothetical protein DSO57_1010514 [Entomophthora muscae]